MSDVNKTVVTDEATFWALLEAGAEVWSDGGSVNAAGCLEELEDDHVDNTWLANLRNDWLPSGCYYIYTE